MILIFGHAEESTAAARSWERLENFSFHVRATWYSVHNRYTERLPLCMTVMRSPWHMSCVLICLFCVRGLVSAYCLVPSYPAELLHTPFLTKKQHARLWMTRSHRPPWFQWRALLQRCLTMTCSNLYWSLQTICRRQGWLFQICVICVRWAPESGKIPEMSGFVARAYLCSSDPLHLDGGLRNLRYHDPALGGGISGPNQKSAAGFCLKDVVHTSMCFSFWSQYIYIYLYVCMYVCM